MDSQSFDWDELLICINDKRVIPIVGKELLYVTIDGKDELLETFLVKRLVKELDLPQDRLAQNSELNDVAMLLYDQRGEGERRKIYSRLKAIMQQHDIQFPESLRKLATISDFKLFISLTFDSLLQDAINHVRFSGANTTVPLVYSPNREINDIPDKVENLHSPYVFQIFGQLSSTTDYAVTDEDILEFTHALQTENRPHILFDELRNHHLLFLGCGFQNWLQRFVVRTISNDRMLTRETYGFIADDGVRSDSNLTVFLKHYKTEVFLSGLATEFVDELYSRWCNHNPAFCGTELTDSKIYLEGNSKSQPERPQMIPGAIFLSYTSEDVAAAHNMKSALDAAGLYVWFDKVNLAPGIAWDHEIQRNIKRCSFFIPLISKNAQSRLEGYFRKEWKWAIDRGEGMADSLKFIHPVIIDRTPDQADAIPPYFSSRQCSRFPDGKPSPEFVNQLVQSFREHQLRDARYN